MDRFKTMESFIRVARAGSFTTAADQMRMSRAMISRRIQELETRLGARLLNRTTRFVKLTDIGTAYFEFCQELLGGIDERERSIVRPQSQLQGSLKISASKGFGVYASPMPSRSSPSNTRRSLSRCWSPIFLPGPMILLSRDCMSLFDFRQTEIPRLPPVRSAHSITWYALPLTI